MSPHSWMAATEEHVHSALFGEHPPDEEDPTDPLDAQEFAGASADPSRELGVGELVWHNLAIGCGAVAFSAFLLALPRIGDWAVLQVRLCRALATSPLSIADLHDNDVLASDIAVVLLVTALATITIGSRKWWVQNIDRLRGSLGLLPWQAMLLKVGAVNAVRGIVMLVFLRQFVMVLSWAFSPPVPSVPVLPPSQFGMHFPELAKAHLGNWTACSTLRHGDCRQHEQRLLRVRQVAAELTHELEASGWVLFDAGAREANTLEAMQQQALRWAQTGAASAGWNAPASDPGVGQHEGIALRAAWAAKELRARIPGVGRLGVGVDLRGLKVSDDRQRLEGVQEAPSLVGLASPSRPLPAAHPWHPFPVMARSRNDKPQPSIWVQPGLLVDRLTMVVLYAATVGLWMAVELGFVRFPAGPRSSHRIAYAALVGLHCWAIGMLRVFGRLNQSGVGFPTIILTVTQFAPVPLLLIGGMSLLFGMATANIVKRYAHGDVLGMAVVVTLNLVFVLWSNRAGDALAEAITLDAASAEGLGVGWVTGSALPENQWFLTGAASATWWADVSLWGGSWSCVQVLDRAFKPSTWLVSLVLRALVAAFAAAVIAVWARALDVVGSTVNILTCEFGAPVVEGSPSLRRAPTVVVHVMGVLEQLFGTADQLLPERPEEAAGASRMPTFAAFASRITTWDEAMTSELVMNMLGMFVGLSSLTEFRERLVFSQAVTIPVTAATREQLQTGGVVLRLSVTPKDTREATAWGADWLPSAPQASLPLLQLKFRALTIPAVTPDESMTRLVRTQVTLEMGLRGVARVAESARNWGLSSIHSLDVAILAEPTEAPGIMGSLRAAADLFLPKRLCVPIATWDSREGWSGEIMKWRPPTIGDVERHREMLNEAERKVERAVQRIWETTHASIIRTKDVAENDLLVRRLRSVEQSLKDLRGDLEASRSNLHRQMTLLKFLRSLFVVSIIHNAELKAGECREVTKVVMAEVGSTLLRIFVNQSFERSSWSQPVLKLVTTGLVLAMQWGMDWSTSDEVIEAMTRPEPTAPPSSIDDEGDPAQHPRERIPHEL
jgi:hypothetical protein